jgi:protein NrfD
MKHFWQWPIASYLFLGGLGGGMLFLVGILRLGFGYSGEATSGGVICALVALALGCFFLVFELGQWSKAPRVVLSATAIIKWGAVLLSIALIAGFFYAVFYLPGMPGDDAAGITNPLMAIACIAGLSVCVYTGVLLATMKAHPFWNSPALPVLFTISAVSTGSSLLALTIGIWPSAGGVEALISGAMQHEMLHTLDSVLVLVELLVIMLYVILMASSSNLTAKKVGLRWLKGEFAGWFWGGMVVGGLALPYLLYGTDGVLSDLVAPVLVILAGLLLRFLMVYSDDRGMVPGEEDYYRHLPDKDEAFLHTWEQGRNLY